MHSKLDFELGLKNSTRMRAIKWICGLWLFGLAACGGGGGDGGGGGAGTSISVSPTSLTFSALEGADNPASQTVHVNYSGDGVIVGYAPGVPQPAWLNVVRLGSASTTSVEFTLSASDTQTTGTRTVNVRFVTGKEDGSN